MTRHEPGPHYRRAIRTLLRYAVVMAFVGLLVGISYQESAKKLPPGSVPTGFHQEATLHLALVHGHVFVMGVLLPVALAGALVLGRHAGGAEVSSRGVWWLTRGYLPLAAAALALQLYKGYHFLLMARAGERDLGVIDHAFMGGSHVLRYGVYAVVHAGMGVALGVFLVLLWKSLNRRTSP